MISIKAHINNVALSGAIFDLPFAVMGAVLAIQGAAWGLAVGLILFFMLFEGKKKASEQVAVGAADDKANQKFH